MSSSGRNKKGHGTGEEDIRRTKRSTSSNVDFVQRYSKEEYSRAIPTNVLTPQPKPRLGEYCIPVDSKQHHPAAHRSASVPLEGYSRDLEVGYAQPQDSLLTSNVSNARKGKKDEDADSDEEGEVYELAKQTSEEYHVPPAQKKPSPKPRKSQVRSPQHEVKNKNPPSETSSSSSSSYALSRHEEKASSSEYNMASAVSGFDPAHDQFPSDRRRPPKKVVEIEYEVASEIRKSQPPGMIDPPPLSSISHHPSQRASLPHLFGANASLSTSNNKDNVPPQHYPTQIPPQGFRQNSSDALSSSSATTKPQFIQEELYEEPWDLKAKRLKQEQEEKKLSRQKSEVLNFQDNSPQVYEEAWDSATSQRKLDEKIKFARSFSTVSESEVYHDAMEDTSPAPKQTEVRRDSNPSPKVPVSNLQPLPPQPTDTYEDAWDLKNRILEERLSQIHMQAQSTYEEPWDNSRRQKELQDKLQRTRQAAGDKPVRVGPNLTGPVLRSTSDARDIGSQNAQEVKANITRGRHHSMDNTNMKSKSSRSGVVGHRINLSIPLINQSWFHGNISRDDAEQMLRVSREGSYIVRISSDRKSYSLSIKSARQNIHVQIEQSAQLDGSLRYILGKNSKEFVTIPEMIDYYTQHRVPLKGAEHITLLHPVECKWSQQQV